MPFIESPAKVLQLGHQSVSSLDVEASDIAAEQDRQPSKDQHRSPLPPGGLSKAAASSLRDRIHSARLRSVDCATSPTQTDCPAKLSSSASLTKGSPNSTPGTQVTSSHKPPSKFTTPSQYSLRQKPPVGSSTPPSSRTPPASGRPAPSRRQTTSATPPAASSSPAPRQPSPSASVSMASATKASSFRASQRVSPARPLSASGRYSGSGASTVSDVRPVQFTQLGVAPQRTVWHAAPDLEQRVMAMLISRQLLDELLDAAWERRR